MAKAQQEKVSFVQRLKQIGTVFSFTAKRDRLFVPLIAVAVGVPVVFTALAVWLLGGWIWVPTGVMLALLATLIVLNIRSNAVVMREAEGQPGAAAQILEMMRGDWRVTPAVQVTTQLDAVHRVIGKPGIVLVAEGSPQRLRSLLAQEKKRLSRVAGSTPIYDFIIGKAEGQTPIKKIQGTIRKLPANLTGKQVNALDTRLTALGAGTPRMPKGPVPKNMKPPRGMMRAMRGK